MEMIKAMFERKATSFTAKQVKVETVVRVSGAELDMLLEKPFLSYDFIKGHKDDMYVDAEGVYHCILAVSDERMDGLLIESEGADYARYASYAPYAAVLAEPVLRDLLENLRHTAEKILLAGRESKRERCSVIEIEKLESCDQLDITENPALQKILSAMLQAREEIAKVEVGEDKIRLEFIREQQEPQIEPCF